MKLKGQINGRGGGGGVTVLVFEIRHVEDIRFSRFSLFERDVSLQLSAIKKLHL